MPIYKRGKFYWIDISTPDGKRIRRSTKISDKLKAQEYYDKIKHEQWAIERLDKKPDRFTDDLLMLGIKDADGQSSYSNKKIYAKYFRAVFANRNIATITGSEILDKLPTHNNVTGKRLSNATINRYRAFIIRCFSLAHKMGWIDKCPYVARLREPKVRVRWIEKDTANELIKNLRLDWMKKIVSFALLTGMRKGEIFSLTWNNINLRRRVASITADNAKSGRGRAIPLNDDAISILMNIEKNSKYVFSVDGSKINQISRTDFANAVKLTGLDDFRFHDLRHTWASWHIQNGTPLMILKEMGGWETLEMVNKYAHLSGEHLAKYSNTVTFLTQKNIESSYPPKLTVISS